MDASPPNVRIATVGACSAATVLWRLQGALNLTVVVKGTFAFGTEGPMSVVDADEIIRAEQHFGDNPTRSLRASSELAPSLPRADVLLTGHACAPAGNPAPALSVRLVVFRDAPLVDKAIHVRGEMTGTDVAAFDRIPLVLERAFGGPGFEDNPYGRGAVEGGPAPNLLDPRHPRRPACFAPIPRAFVSRRRLLGTTDRRVLDQPIAEIPMGFDWTYFQSAPEDQRTEYLHGNEWVVLERMTAEPTFVRSHLPAARGVARISGLAGVPEDRAFPLAGDTLRIDADRLRCSVVWRRSFPVASVAELAGIRVQAAVQIDRANIDWPAFEPAERLSVPAPALPTPPSVEASASDEASRDRGFTGTLVIEPEQGERVSQIPVVPFKPGPANPRPSPTRPPEDPPELRETLPITGVAAIRPQSPPSMPFARRTPVPSLDGADDEAPVARRFEREARPEPAPPPFEPTPPVAAAPKAPPPGVTIAPNESLSCEATAWGLSPSRDCYVVLAKATADLVPGGPAKLRVPDPLSDERWLESASGGRVLLYPSDRSKYKVRADVVAIANAYPPKSTATSVEARFAFGASGNAFARSLLVFGDRRWEKRGHVAVASTPEPFLRMPLGWERAFGGKGHEDNPLGLGIVDRKHRGPVPLPNVEDPGHRLRTPRQIVAPMSIAPVSLASKARAAASSNKRSLPEELDWTRYQIAPPEQQLAFLRGDEPYVFVGMHRAHPTLEGALPGIRVRAFAASLERFDEVPTRLDTVVFTVDELRVDLVFRGMLPVPSEAAPPSVVLHFLTEPAAGPLMTVEEARAKIRRA